jgi:signal peptidase I
MKPFRTKLLVTFVFIGVLALLPSWVRAYRVAGPLDAPNYLTGEIVLINLMAYDLKLPYSNLKLLAWAEPQPGDMVLFQIPNEEGLIIKRIAAGPGDVIAMQDNHLMLNDKPLLYQPLPREKFAWVPDENKLGSVVEEERGLSITHWITHTPEAEAQSSFAPVTVPAGHYFILGDNRDHSVDSREFGLVSRDRIKGKVIHRIKSLASVQ